ncbi:MAG TPA: hypothetical protein VHP35_18025 [Terriglobia bacterium]|nr:hypothetical protein [Terriglobia bacterium]
MLHVLNGESTAQTLKQTRLAGEHLAWKEALIWGPTPAKTDLSEWCRLRADFLAGSNALDVDAEQCFADLMQQESVLGALAKHDEVVFWFEFDLFCQLNLIYLLGKLRRQNLASTKLSLICIGEFPGIHDFRGLGQLNAEQLLSLFPVRQPVTPEQIELAERAWNACCSSNPREIELLLAGDTSALRFLRPALGLHLRRFPSVRNGLGHMEQMALDCIARGVTRFSEIFKEWSAAEPGYGLGDAQLWDVLVRMVECRRPLLRLDGNRSHCFSDHRQYLNHVAFTLTETGQAVVAGKRDLWEVEPAELWLGGVRLVPPNPRWRWDEDQVALVG